MQLNADLINRLDGGDKTISFIFIHLCFAVRYVTCLVNLKYTILLFLFHVRIDEKSAFVFDRDFYVVYINIPSYFLIETESMYTMVFACLMNC